MVDKKFLDLKEKVWQALRSWNSNDTTSSLATLHIVRSQQSAKHLTLKQATQAVLQEAITKLSQTDGMVGQFLEWRFLNSQSIAWTAKALGLAESTVYILQRQAIKQLAELIAEWERSISTEHRTLLESRLSVASYENLIGVEESIQSLLQVLENPDPPYLISIEGIGGIGKTALANAVIRQAISHGLFDEIGWITARSISLNLGGGLKETHKPALTTESLVENLAKQLLPGLTSSGLMPFEQLLNALTVQLKRIPHLIVIDNLETVSDVEVLLPILQQLVNPTKFILTSRTRLYAVPNVYHFTLLALNKAHALSLIRQEAFLTNLSALTNCSDDKLDPIYDVVGGNPLALRLIVGQAHIYTLDLLLDDLRQARGATVENLYTYIYRFMWDRLSESGRRLLLVMPLVSPDGDTLDFIAEVAGMELSEVRTTLSTLIELNLVDVRGGLEDRRYSIHALTRSFLHNVIARWE